LGDIFKRNSIKIDSDEPLANTEELVSYVLDELTGAIPRFQKMSTQKKYFLLIAISLFIIGTYLCFNDRLGEGIATYAMGVALILKQYQT
jgi:hypothetical protein